MSYFVKKTVMVEAVRWTGENVLEVYTFMHGAPTLRHDIARDKWLDFESIHRGKEWHIKTLEDGPNGEAKHVASIGDWIIRGVKGELYPCKPDIFELTYSPTHFSAGSSAVTGDPAVDALHIAADILEERRRQRDVEGWSTNSDDEQKLGELAQAAAAYAYYACTHGEEPFVREVRRTAEQMWPFPARWWKPKDQRRDLVRAAALIIAEIERIDRRAAKAVKA